MIVTEDIVLHLQLEERGIPSFFGSIRYFSQEENTSFICMRHIPPIFKRIYPNVENRIKTEIQNSPHRYRETNRLKRNKFIIIALEKYNNDVVFISDPVNIFTSLQKAVAYVKDRRIVIWDNISMNDSYKLALYMSLSLPMDGIQSQLIL